MATAIATMPPTAKRNGDGEADFIALHNRSPLCRGNPGFSAIALFRLCQRRDRVPILPMTVESRAGGVYVEGESQSASQQAGP
ncbi:hypothetical protein [Aquamicrobium terrae]